MANLRILHVDLDSGKIVASGAGGSGGTPSGQFVEISGDTMTGLLTLSADPISNLHATPKRYVDLLISNTLTTVTDADDLLQIDINNKVSKAGDTMLGALTLVGDPVGQLEPVTKQYLEDQAVLVTGGIMSGFLTLSSSPVLSNHAATKGYVDSLTGVGGGVFLETAGGIMSGNLELAFDPINDLDAATKQYVDSVASGLDVKESVRVTTEGLDIALSGLVTIDGIALTVGDRVLVKDQTTPIDNGIYVVGSGMWVRSEDADGTPANEVSSGLFTFVEEGTLNKSTGWVLLTSDPIILGSTALEFGKFSSADNFVQKTGDTMTGPLLLDANPVAPLGAAPKQYIDNEIQNIGENFIQVSPATTWTLLHNRNTTSLVVQAFVGGEIVIPNNIIITDSNTVTIEFAVGVSGEANIIFFG